MENGLIQELIENQIDEYQLSTNPGKMGLQLQIPHTCGLYVSTCVYVN